MQKNVAATSTEVKIKMMKIRYEMSFTFTVIETIFWDRRKWIFSSERTFLWEKKVTSIDSFT